MDLPPDAWPALPEGAYHGLLGRIVRKVEPHTEADPAALLVQTLAVFGNIIGRSAYFLADGARHHGNLFASMVGRSSKGRKGTSLARVLEFFEGVDHHWINSCHVAGMSSGEGMIATIRDGGGDDSDDIGVTDKRLMVVEGEFAQPLRVMRREGNTLSAMLRQAWDTGNLRVLTRKDPLKATGAHISIIGHITLDELKQELKQTDAVNGFANRFLWCCVKRSKLLPEGGQPENISQEAGELRQAIAFAKTCGQMRFTVKGRAMWHDIYPQLSAEIPGLLGNVLGRAEAITMRLSLLYALLDQRREIDAEHLRAALCVWSYCAKSARYIFGDATGDPTVDKVRSALRSAGESGMTRGEINERVFQRNAPSTEIDRCLSKLSEMGLAQCGKEQTGGRPAERWKACDVHEFNELNALTLN